MVDNEIVTSYWGQSSSNYNKLIHNEIDRNIDNIWREEILSYLPKDKKLSILDVGTGPGFFPMVLSDERIKVTGIDISTDMIEKAQKNIIEKGINADLMVLDSQDTKLDEESFDAVICRNVTWTLTDPNKAYKEWWRLLKKGGILLIYDGNWYLPYFFKEEKERILKLKEYVINKYDIEPYDYCFNIDEKEKKMRDGLFLSSKNRPYWDINALTEVGFKEIKAEIDYNYRLFGKEYVLQNGDITRQFMIKAEK